MFTTWKNVLARIVNFVDENILSFLFLFFCFLMVGWFFFSFFEFAYFLTLHYYFFTYAKVPFTPSLLMMTVVAASSLCPVFLLFFFTVAFWISVIEKVMISINLGFELWSSSTLVCGWFPFDRSRNLEDLYCNFWSLRKKKKSCVLFVCWYILTFIFLQAMCFLYIFEVFGDGWPWAFASAIFLWNTVRSNTMNFFFRYLHNSSISVCDSKGERNAFWLREMLTVFFFFYLSRFCFVVWRVCISNV